MAKKGVWFKSEASLCAAFIEAACKDGKWVAYPETQGWDILLVRKADGVQIGIQAKMALNSKVVAQALPVWMREGSTGPDYRAVLVPAGANTELALACDLVGLTVIIQRKPDTKFSSPFHPALPTPGDDGYWYTRHWHPWAPNKRLKLPEYVPDVAAGVAAPQTLSPWKISAIKLQIILEERPVTRADFKALSMSPTRWLDRHYGWLDQTPQGWVRGERMPDFSAQHPRNYVEIKADREKWMPAPKPLAVNAAQGEPANA